jgi:hypothetical protein
MTKTKIAIQLTSAIVTVTTLAVGVVELVERFGNFAAFACFFAWWLFLGGLEDLIKCNRK